MKNDAKLLLMRGLSKLIFQMRSMKLNPDSDCVFVMRKTDTFLIQIALNESTVPEKNLINDQVAERSSDGIVVFTRNRRLYGDTFPTLMTGSLKHLYVFAIESLDGEIHYETQVLCQDEIGDWHLTELPMRERETMPEIILSPWARENMN